MSLSLDTTKRKIRDVYKRQGYIALQDLTKGGDIIRSRTYDAFMPLIAVALIYLIMVMIFTKLVNLLERRLRNSDH